MSIRVLVVDDHPALRAGLRAILELDTDIEVIGEAETGAEAINKTVTLQPDVVLLDSVLPDISGSKVAEKIQRLKSGISVLAFSGFVDEDHVFGMLDSGAVGYVVKTEHPQTVIAAIKNAAKGESYLSPSVSGKVLGRMRQMKSKFFSLSKRERDVLYRIARGHSNEQIAQMLGISQATVKNHLTSIYSKLGVGSRSDAIVWAWENGIVARRGQEKPKRVGQNSHE